MSIILRKTTLWKQSWGGYVSRSRVGGCRCPNGCMTNGALGTIQSWPANIKAVGSTRPMMLWFCSPSIIHWSNGHCQSHPASSCVPKPHLSLQDRFIKYKQKTVTKTDTKISDMETGWYTKDDMVKVLKWNSTLSCNLLGLTSYRCKNIHFQIIFHVFLCLLNPIHVCWSIYSQLRKKLRVLSSAVSRIPIIWSGRHVYIDVNFT